MRGLMLALCAVLTACGGAAPTTAPTPPTAPTPTPTASPRPAADVEASVSDGLAKECADKKSAPDWCNWINLKNKKPDVLLDTDGTVLVSLGKVPDTPAGKKMGAKLCADIAASHYDAKGVDLGYRVVIVGGASNNVLAVCQSKS